MISNPGFETAVDGEPGSPQSWSVAFVATLEETLEFVGDIPTAFLGRETFDVGWSSSGSQVLVEALTAELLEQREVERFDTFSPNQSFMFLTALEAFALDAGTSTIEKFELWEAAADVDARERTLFDGTPREDFEDAWGTAEFSLTGVNSAIFDVSGLSTLLVPALAELFAFKPRVRVRSSIGDNRLVADIELTPALSVIAGDAVTFVVVGGELPQPLFENRTYIVRDTGSNWFTIAPHPGADAIDLTADGFGAVYVQSDPGSVWIDEL